MFDVKDFLNMDLDEPIYFYAPSREGWTTLRELSELDDFGNFKEMDVDVDN